MVLDLHKQTAPTVFNRCSFGEWTGLKIEYVVCVLMMYIWIKYQISAAWYKSIYSHNLRLTAQSRLQHHHPNILMLQTQSSIIQFPYRKSLINNPRNYTLSKRFRSAPLLQNSQNWHRVQYIFSPTRLTAFSNSCFLNECLTRSYALNKLICGRMISRRMICKLMLCLSYSICFKVTSLICSQLRLWIAF